MPSESELAHPGWVSRMGLLQATGAPATARQGSVAQELLVHMGASGRSCLTHVLPRSAREEVRAWLWVPGLLPHWVPHLSVLLAPRPLLDDPSQLQRSPLNSASDPQPGLSTALPVGREPQTPRLPSVPLEPTEAAASGSPLPARCWVLLSHATFTPLSLCLASVNAKGAFPQEFTPRRGCREGRGKDEVLPPLPCLCFNWVRGNEHPSTCVRWMQ